MTSSPSPRARRPINPGAAPVPPRAGGDRHKLRRVRFVVFFGVALVITLLIILLTVIL
ncbi:MULTISPECIES: hypothetical protein [Williamsia]|uniref:Uncharacterized protein n=1 Tax=Williamsia marianensis TaxID=85044 RepID=A0A315S6X4_WILMA|nr:MULTISPECIES: hypothetical protein [Williamsia]ETD30817.1 hypothetical protein W823_22625 [Williamsia sp. D3]PVY26297.1 hypothetical protein C7458_11712 [Williamsia marianensis]RKR79880.1 hypothetical protein DFJ75_5023 [Williamsia muralis]